MAQQFTLTEADGLAKRIYGDKLENLIPEFAQWQTDIPFKRAKKLGLQFEQPVILGMEQGVSYLKFKGGPKTLGKPVASSLKNALVQGSQHFLVSQIDYETLFSCEGDPEAFKNSTGLLFESMMESIRRRLEIDLGYGQCIQGLGTLTGSPGSVAAGASVTWTITTAEWAPGIWAGMENAQLDVYAAPTGGPPTTTFAARLNTAKPLTLTTADLEARTITVSNPTGGTTTSPSAGAVIFFSNDNGTASPQEMAQMPAAGNIFTASNMMAGIHRILAADATYETANDETFGILPSVSALWRSVQQSAGSLDLSFDTFLKAGAKLTAKGASGEVKAYINPLTWANLMSDQAALRRYTKEDGNSTYELGANEIKFHNQTGTFTIKAHPCVKEGYAYAIQPKLWKRLGATDITFDNARMESLGGQPSGSQFFVPVQGANYVEMKCYSHQALFSTAPGKSIFINNIVNS